MQDGDGKTIVMKCHKSGFEFEMLREGYTPSTEIDVAKAARYLGRYRSKLQSADYEVRVQNHRLAVDIPGMAIVARHPPIYDGKMSFLPIYLQISCLYQPIPIKLFHMLNECFLYRSIVNAKICL